MTQEKLVHVIVGGGAAGFFASIACGQFYPCHHVILLEKTRQLLAKVRISGGGRCNVTHSCFDPALLVRHYPRGGKELRGPFTRFQPKDTIHWFESHGAQLKTEEDGRIFPITDSSETIIQCLYKEANKAGVDIRLEKGVAGIEKADCKFHLTLADGEEIICDRLLMATGSTAKIYPLIEALGHSIIPLVPSLFTFNVPDSPLLDLAGIAVPHAQVKLPEIGFEQIGPVLITHWGFSGPAILKLSAWGARELHSLDYQTKLILNWIPDFSEEEGWQMIWRAKEQQAQKQISTEALFGLPKQLWKKLIHLTGIGPEQRWATLSKKQVNVLLNQLKSSSFKIQGKTTYKQEFVTCGGVSLDEVDFKTMESRLCKGLYFAGEILNIDGITGGFNFQNAWTTGWIAGLSMGMA